MIWTHRRPVSVIEIMKRKVQWRHNERDGALNH